ncbi:MAG: malto-oligosyltrehalose synthase [Gemmatimonadetes bacterium]|nr:malto-oligosyltrehalose synthase [Gemmatimonadota bacterium]
MPVATYRLQINDDFTLHDARGIVSYLAHLGISDLYLSPVFEARSGSTHGYDVTDPTRIRASVGGMDALRELAREARAHYMGILLDIVPNHMAASVENPWWQDVLEHGQTSAYAAFFDIDWGTPAEPRRLALPILGDRLDAVIERGEIAIDEQAGVVRYFETGLPLAPESIGGDTSGGDTSNNDTSGSDIRDTLDRQHYELVPWWTASDTMAYRRFFDITDLAGVRVEDAEVFRTSHSLIRELAAEGIISGLRIDHIDGLADPAGYLRQLRGHVHGPDGKPVFTLVEKILESSETLPIDWECEGTTGYEFLSLATALLVEPDGHSHMSMFYRRISGDARQFNELAREKKLLIMERLLGGELAVLARELSRLTGVGYATSRRAIAEVTASMQVYRTYIRDENAGTTDRRRIAEAVRDAVQRTNEPELESMIATLRSVALLEYDGDRAAHLAWVRRWQQFTGPVMAKGYEDTALYCHNALLAANDVGSDPSRPSMTASELTAALSRRSGAGSLSLNATATHDTKRGEDTRARIAVLSEVPDEWRSRLRRWMREGDEWKNEIADEEDTVAPSADVESLLYQTLLGSWPQQGIDDAFRARIQAYMTKAVREAKEQTSWRQPDEDYENALGAFIERLMAEVGREGLAEDVGAFAQRLAPHGALNGIAQMLLKVTAPGIPDIYQGTELWSHTLVDPDNRVPVDFALRQALFDDIVSLRDTPDPSGVRALLASWEDGRIKLLLTAIALRFRATHRDVFEGGDVVGLEATGIHARHVFAFARMRAGRACITVVPRWTALLPQGTTGPEAWGDTALTVPPQLRRTWHNAITGETHGSGGALPAAEIFRAVPFALLEVSRPIGA